MTCAFGRNSLISKWDAAEARPSIEQIRDGGFCVNSALFSPIFSRAREKIGPSGTTCSCKSARINPSGASRQLPLHKGALVRAQVESLPFQGRWLGEAVTERSSQICSNLSVSAAPSQHPYPFCPFGTFPPDRGNRPLEGEPRNAHRRKYSKAGDDLSVSLRLPAPLGGEPCGEKSPPRGARGLLFTVSVWFYPQKTLS